jgi:hypothetical protein
LRYIFIRFRISFSVAPFEGGRSVEGRSCRVGSPSGASTS